MKKDANAYDPSSIEKKWQAVWEKSKVYSPNLDKPFDKAQGHGRPFYNLMMFPYPSAEGMHVGNMYAFTGADVYGRFQRMQGNDVFEPIGLDGFGIHSENYALKIGKHPMEQAEVSEKNFYRQMRATGNAYDWQRTVETYKKDYYKWTQWLFIEMFKAGLAYRKKAPVNFCPSCKTVLADEQVIDGKCERCSSIVEKRDLEQWFFKITDYAERLLNNIPSLNWTEKVKVAQREWIGRSEGVQIEFKVQNPASPAGRSKFKVEVFTTRPDTLYGATFLVVSPEHPFSKKISSKEVQDYIKEAGKKSDIERTAEGKEKTGVFSGFWAINPLNGEKIAIWIADYALMGYGTGALFGDAHDERDVEFANKYDIPLKVTVITGDAEKDKRIKNFEEVFTGYGTIIDSGEFSNLSSETAKKKVVEWLEKHKKGSKKTSFHLRDWLISRQRYWGSPIPMIYCEKCEWQPVADKDLPVKLPYIQDYKPLGTGVAPLAAHPEFYETKCPKCGGGTARRETDVSDTFLDSAWYFFRYLATDWNDMPFPSVELAKSDKGIKNLKLKIENSAQRAAWLPVNMYIGGAEHSVLHLLYSRFITMFLKDLGYIDFEEPFSRFYSHGLIIKDGAKMSKSKGNVVVPDEYIKKFGADTLRMYLMFIGPFSGGGDFRDSGIEGMSRFVRRVYTLLTKAQISNFKFSIFNERNGFMHKTIKKVTEDLEKLHYNTAIAALMEWYNFLSSKLKVQNEKLTREEAEVFVKLLAPFAPHMTEELWQRLQSGLQTKDYGLRITAVDGSQWTVDSSIHKQSWPTTDNKYLVSDEVTVVVQINGKTRDTVSVQSSKLKVQSFVEQSARESDKVKSHLESKQVRKVIYVEGKIINFVTG